MKAFLLIHKRLSSIVIGLLVFFVFTMTAYSIYIYQVENHKRQAASEIHALAMSMESLISNEIHLASGLDAYLVTNKEADFNDLNAYAQNLYRYKNNALRSVALLKDTTVFFVYPLKSNESLLGIDLAQIEPQRENVLFVKNNIKTLISAPVDLVQGGRGIVIRYPIVHKNEEGKPTYDGQMSIVIDYDLLATDTGLKKMFDKYAIRIESVRPDSSEGKLVYGNIDTVPLDASLYTINLPNTVWAFYYKPQSGWNGSSPILYSVILLGLVFSVLVYKTVQKQLNTSEYLSDLVHERTSALLQTNEYLEQTLGEVEEKQAEMYLLNDQLERSLDELKETQDQLIQSEKFAALGELVAGVAHEINTPLGIGITLASFVQDQHYNLKKAFENNQLSKQDLIDFNATLDESLPVMLNSLNRSAEIVSSFKNVAGEQSTLEARKFNMKSYLEDVIQNLRPRLKRTQHEIQLSCPEHLEIYQFPGAFSHILTNFVVNSLVHGFEDTEHGQIHIQVFVEGGKGFLVYTDNGKGIPLEDQNKVFDPFFTTKRGQGSTGLGLHIVHNVVTQTLKGKVTLKSSLNEGVQFTIEFPLLIEN